MRNYSRQFPYPTSQGEESILDLALYNLTVGQPFSDHNSINLLLSRSSHGDRRSEKLAYSFRKADWEHLRNLLGITPLGTVLFLKTTSILFGLCGRTCYYRLLKNVFQNIKARDSQTHHGLTAISSNSAEKRNYSTRGLKNRLRSLTGSIIISLIIS